MQQDSLWQAVLGEIELSVSRGNFVTWFKNTCLLKQVDDTAVIGVPNIFIKQQLEKKYSDLIGDVLKKNGVAVSQIEFKISSAATRTPSESDTVLSEPPNNPIGQQASPKPAAKSGNSFSHSYRQGLNERYTFDSFIVGASNELAFAACQAIAQQPGTRYNPLFLYGGVGIGKTHLIQAVGNTLAKRSPDAKVLYISTEQFSGIRRRFALPQDGRLCQPLPNSRRLNCRRCPVHRR